MEELILIAFSLFMAYGLINFSFKKKPGYVKIGPHTEARIDRHGAVAGYRLSPEYVESKEFKDKLLSDQAMILEDIRREQKDRHG